VPAPKSILIPIPHVIRCTPEKSDLPGVIGVSRSMLM
jgi:hypothetical protein